MTREQIETYLNLEGRVHLFKSCLPYVAYNLVKGPFRQVWVRYGFDPKKDPSTAIYQTIHFRVASKVVQDITERYERAGLIYLLYTISWLEEIPFQIVTHHFAFFSL